MQGLVDGRQGYSRPYQHDPERFPDINMASRVDLLQMCILTEAHWACMSTFSSSSFWNPRTRFVEGDGARLGSPQRCLADPTLLMRLFSFGTWRLSRNGTVRPCCPYSTIAVARSFFSFQRIFCSSLSCIITPETHGFTVSFSNYSDKTACSTKNQFQLLTITQANCEFPTHRTKLQVYGWYVEFVNKQYLRLFIWYTAITMDHTSSATNSTCNVEVSGSKLT